MSAPTSIILVEHVHDGTTYRYATAECNVLNQQYYRGLEDPPDLSQELSEIWYGYQDRSDVKLTLTDPDGTFSDFWAADTELRGDKIRIKRVDFNRTSHITDETEWAFDSEWGYDSEFPETTDRIVAQIIYTLIGKVKQFSTGTGAEIVVTFNDPDVFEAELGSATVGSVTWTNEDAVSLPREDDLGNTINIVYGRARKVLLSLINNDNDNDKYDYLIGYGTIEATNADKGVKIQVYRNGAVVPTDKYTVYDGSQGSPYPGYAFIRFDLEQTDYSGSHSFYEIRADVYGLEMGSGLAQRNGIRQIEQYISDSTYGLNESVNAASFNTAARAVIAYTEGLDEITLGEFRFDGVIDSAVKANDIISTILHCLGAKLTRNDDDEWVVNVDTYQSDYTKAFHHGNAGNADGFLELPVFSSKATDQTVKTLAIEYGLNPETGEYTYTTSDRTVHSDFGEDRTEQLDCVWDGLTADMIASLWQHRYIYGDKRAECTLDDNAKGLNVGDVVALKIPSKSIDFDTYQIEKLNRSMKKGFPVELSAYSQDIYIYTEGDLPEGSTCDDPTDWSLTPPATPTDLTVAGSGSYQGGATGDGRTSAYVTLTAVKSTTNPQNFAKIQFGIRRYGENDDSFTWYDGTDTGTGNIWQCQISDITSGYQYEVAARAVNQFDLPGAITATTTHTGAGDGDAPDPPTGLAVTSNVGNCSLDWDDNSEDDLAKYYVYRNGGKIAEADVSRFVDATGLSMGTTYTYTVKAVDYTGNASSACSGVTGTPRKTDTGDIEDRAVGATQIALACITTAHIDSLTVSDAWITSLSASKITTGTIAGTETITMAAGGDIVLTPDNSNPAELRWTNIGKIYAGVTLAGIFIEPSTADRSLWIGSGASQGWDVINFGMQNNSDAAFLVGNAYTSAPYFRIRSTEIMSYLNLEPSSDSSKDLGSSSKKWSTVWADNILATSSVGIQFVDGSYSNTYFRPTSGQHIVFGGGANNEPADAECLNNGDYLFYFYESGGITYLNAKTKNSAGVVKKKFLGAMTD